MQALIECGATLFVGGVAYGVTIVLSLRKLDSTRDARYNSNLFVGIVVAIYAGFRLYFGVCSYFSSMVKNDMLRRWVNFIMLAFGVSTLIPLADVSVGDLFQLAFGDMPYVLLEHCYGNIDWAVAFGIRVFALISVWCFVLFIMEVLLSMMMKVVVYIGRLIVRYAGGTKSQTGSDVEICKGRGDADDLCNFLSQTILTKDY